MTVYEKSIEIFCNCNDPCLYYAYAWRWYKKGKISDELWNKFVFACLENLMEKNKDVLDRLKN